MKKIISLLLILTLSVAAFAKDDTNTVKIGVILPLTGNMAQVGQPQLAAVELFKKECESGHYKHKYQVLVEDDAMTGRLTAEAANRFFNVEHVDGLVDLFSGTGNITAPRARAAKVPHLSIASDIKIADQRFNFLNWTIPETEAKRFADIIQKLKAKRVVFLTVRQQGFMAIEKSAEDELKKRGIPFIANVYYTSPERDFRTLLLKIRDQQKPDVFVPLGLSPEEEIILRQAKQMGLNAKVTSIESFDILDDEEDAEGLFYVSEGNGTDEFKNRTLQATGKPSTYVVPYTYESLNILRAAYESTDTIDHKAAAQWIAHMKDFPSALGKISTMPDGRIDSPAGIFQIVHGKPIPATLEEIK